MRKDEAYVMMDAFRIAFEQQLRRGSEKVLQLAESDTHTAEKGAINNTHTLLRTSLCRGFQFHNISSDRSAAFSQNVFCQDKFV